MKRTALAAVVAVAFVVSGSVLAACGGIWPSNAGTPTNESRQLPDLHAVRLETHGDLTIRIGTPAELTVQAGANIIGDLTSDVVDGVLVLGTSTSRGVTGSVTYVLTVPALDGVALDGSGDVRGAAVLAGDARLDVSGSGSAALSGLDLTSLAVDLSGSGDATVSGVSPDSTVTVSGAGTYDGSALHTRRTTIDSNGSGQATVFATERLVVDVSGSGDVIYLGDPPVVDQQVSGSGEVVTAP